MPQNTPQVTVFLDTSGRLHIEAPGKNGARQKIDIPLGFETANPELMFELQSQADEIQRKAAEDLKTLQRANFVYVYETHGLSLARKVIGNPEATFNNAWRRKLAREAEDRTADKKTLDKTAAYNAAPILDLET